MNINIKDYSILKLTFNWSRTGVVSIKTISQTKICSAGGCGYDKKAAVFKELFKKLGFDHVSKICESKFDLNTSTIEAMNNFFKENQINYKINYKSEINKNIDFIELEKL